MVRAQFVTILINKTDKMNKIDQTTYSHLTKSQLTQLRKACKIANLDFKAMACRPKDGLQLIKDVENRTGLKL